MLYADSVTTEERGKVWVSSRLICGKCKETRSWCAHTDAHTHTCTSPSLTTTSPFIICAQVNTKSSCGKGVHVPRHPPHPSPAGAHRTRHSCTTHNSHYWRMSAAHHDIPHHCRGRQKPGVPATTRREHTSKYTLCHLPLSNMRLA